MLIRPEELIKILNEYGATQIITKRVETMIAINVKKMLKPDMSGDTIAGFSENVMNCVKSLFIFLHYQK